MNSNLNRVFILLILILSFVWLVVPFTMAVLWSLVDPSEPWTADKIFPPVMSFYRWNYMWENSNLKKHFLILMFSTFDSIILFNFVNANLICIWKIKFSW